jgi:hypothetical protein
MKFHVVSFRGGLGKDATRPWLRALSQPKFSFVTVLTTLMVSRRNLHSKRNARCKNDSAMIYYANAVHGFTNPEYGDDNSKGAVYNEKSI